MLIVVAGNTAYSQEAASAKVRLIAGDSSGTG